MEALSAEVSRIQEAMAVKNKYSRRGEPVGGSADRRQGTGEPIHRTNQSSGEDSFVKSKDRTDGRLHGGRYPGGCIKEIQDVCHIFCRFGAEWRKSTSIDGGFRANVRRRCRTMDARPSGRHARGNSGRGCVTSWALQPQVGRQSHHAAFHCVQRSPMRSVPTWGYRGVRVGEASNPGPAVTRQGRRLERSTQIDVSSDEEPLVRPNFGRHVVARRIVEEGVPSTVPATPVSLAQRGRQLLPSSDAIDVEEHAVAPGPELARTTLRDDSDADEEVVERCHTLPTQPASARFEGEEDWSPTGSFCLAKNHIRRRQVLRYCQSCWSEESETVTFEVE